VKFESFLCEEVANVNNSSSLGTSKTDWDRISAMSDEDIDFSDAPEATEAQIAGAVFRVGGVVADRGQQVVSMALDAAIVDYFKQQAGDGAYQTLIAGALLDYIDRNPLPSPAA
jgi:uncharacterized protein (DUF4415 family)